MNYAVVKKGLVVNLVDADEAFAEKHGLIPAERARIGDTWDGEKFTTPEKPEPPAKPLTDIQKIIRQDDKLLAKLVELKVLTDQDVRMIKDSTVDQLVRPAVVI